MKIVVYDKEIECPESAAMRALVEGMGFHQVLRLCRWQAMPKNWPKHDNIPSYCLYMGSGEYDGEKVDFYHYEPGETQDYSTGIVMGNEGGDYRSGWPSLAVKRDVYKEHMRREFLCGFLRVDDLVRVGIAALGIEREGPDVIREVRKDFRLGPEEQYLE